MKHGKLLFALAAVSLLALAVPMDSHATEKPPTGTIPYLNGICDSDGDRSKFCQGSNEVECSTTSQGYQTKQCCEDWDGDSTCHKTDVSAEKILCQCTNVHTGAFYQNYFYIRYSTTTLPGSCDAGQTCVHHN